MEAWQLLRSGLVEDGTVNDVRRPPMYVSPPSNGSIFMPDSLWFPDPHHPLG